MNGMMNKTEVILDHEISNDTLSKELMIEEHKVN